MYDPNSEPREFVGEGREEAIEKACRFFGLESDELLVTEFPKGEVYGLASRSVIVAAPRSARPRRAAERSGDRSGNRRDDRPGREARRDDRGHEGPSEPSVGTARGELGEVGTFLLGLMERMDVGPFEIGESQEGKLVVFEVRGAAARALASGDGRAVDALQLLANQVAIRMSSEPQRVVVDVEGNAEARESFLSRLAHRMAGRSLQTRRAVALDPMNPKDRRIIHLALRDEQGVATMSIGEGRYRQVVVVPRGAPEFEEARRQSEMAASRSDS